MINISVAKQETDRPNPDGRESTGTQSVEMRHSEPSAV